MIGVIANLTEYGVVCEFFELFKTPWEFYQSNQRYKVLLCTDPFVKRLVSEMRAKPDRCLWGVALGGGFDSRARALREAREGPGACSLWILFTGRLGDLRAPCLWALGFVHWAQ